uniref:protein-ribulosamine 3-kinase n=1 Tax=Rhizophora mucronata TaxID=61149 RepID=A0A2P2LBA5_RHIMU
MSEDPIREWIMSEGKATQITRISSVGGGCINLANRYDTDAGSFFVKTNRSIGPAMFEGEALGLGAMYETRTIRVPRPFKHCRLEPYRVVAHTLLWNSLSLDHPGAIR